MSWYPFVVYDPKYPKLFKEEKEKIKMVLGKDLEVKHFGSTAVPGLPGKGYIDIYVVCPKDKMQSVSRILQKKLDYIHKPHAGVENERIFLKKKQDNEVFHLHITYPENKNLKECLHFRDYLIKHPKAAKRYANIKKSAAQKSAAAKTRKQAKKIYLKTKQNFIESISSQ